MKKAKIKAVEYYLPNNLVTNDDLDREHPNWGINKLASKTGVFSRFIVGNEETSLDLSLKAIEKLITKTNLDLQEVDALIVCTQTPDFIMPPNACLIHGKLGLRQNTIAFDINLACSGYVYGLDIINSLIASGRSNKILFVTGDTYSKYIHPDDRAVKCLFGDGVAVTLIESSDDESGIIDVHSGTNGTKYDRFYIEAGGCKMPKTPETKKEFSDNSGNTRTKEHISMDGFGVLSFFGTLIPKEVKIILKKNNLVLDDIDAFLFHQASHLALNAISKALKISDDKMIIDMSDIGNLVSASIPVALSRALEKGSIKKGNLVLLCGFGVGLSWGTVLIKI